MKREGKKKSDTTTAALGYLNSGMLYVGGGRSDGCRYEQTSIHNSNFALMCEDGEF